MRFTPVTFFGQGLAEPCVSASAIGAVSQSYNIGGVIWNTYMFSCSLQEGGGGVETFQFTIENGATRRGIVAIVGAGGSGASSGEGGGGGGFNVLDNVFLTQGTYQVFVGQGGTGTNRGTLGLPFSGDDGSNSRLLGNGIDIVVNGGDGGYLNGFGGNSGNGTTSANDAGAGVAENNPASITQGGYGLSFYFGSGSNIPLFRAGGGGPSEFDVNARTPGGYDFGGGDGAFPSPGTEINGSGGDLRDGVLTFGGGGTGGQYYRSSDERYVSSAGGGGLVFIAIPTNLCTSSLYDIDNNIVTDSLLTNFNVSSARTVGKSPLSNVIYDERFVYKLYHTNTLIASGSIYDEGLPYYINSYTSSVNSFVINDDIITFSKRTAPIDYNLPDYLSGSIDLDVSQDFSLEIIGKMSSAARSDQNMVFLQLLPESGLSRIDLYIDRTSPATTVNSQVRYNDGAGNNYETSLVSSDSNIHQHVITYTPGSLKWYRDTVLLGTLSVNITSSLDNPNIVISNIYQSDDNPNDDRYIQKLGEFRIYTKELSPLEIEQNYSASIYSYYPTAEFTHSFSYNSSDDFTACQATPNLIKYSFDEVLTTSSKLLDNQIFPFDYVSNGYYATGSVVYQVTGGSGNITSISSCPTPVYGTNWRICGAVGYAINYSYRDPNNVLHSGTLYAGDCIFVCVLNGSTPTVDFRGSVTNLGTTCVVPSI